MSSEAWSRALMEVGGGLDKIAGYHAQKERDQAQHLRDESLMRLRNKHAKELQSERITADDERSRQVMEHRETMEAGAREHRENLAAGSNQLRRDLAEEANTYQDRRMQAQEVARVEAASAVSMRQIDDRIADLQDQISDARFSAAENMTEADAATLTSVQGQIAYMQNQRKLAKLTELTTLQKIGADAYKDLSEDELAIKAGYTEAEVKAAREALEGKPEDKPKEKSRRLADDPAENNARWQKKAEEQEAAKEQGVGKDATAGTKYLLEPIRNEDGSLKHPGKEDAPLLKVGRWFASDATEFFGS